MISRAFIKTLGLGLNIVSLGALISSPTFWRLWSAACAKLVSAWATLRLSKSPGNIASSTLVPSSLPILSHRLDVNGVTYTDCSGLETTTVSN